MQLAYFFTKSFCVLLPLKLQYLWSTDHHNRLQMTRVQFDRELQIQPLFNNVRLLALTDYVTLCKKCVSQLKQSSLITEKNEFSEK